MVRCTYCLNKSLTSSNQDTIRLKAYCPLKALFSTLKYPLQLKVTDNTA